MKVRNFFILFFVFFIIFFCSIYLEQFETASNCLYNTYFGFSIENKKIIGFNFIMNMGINISMIYLGIKYIDNVFGMYDIISIRYIKSKNFFIKLSFDFVKICFFSSLIFSALHIMFLLISKEKIDFSIFILTSVFFLSFMIWFYIIFLFFLTKTNYTKILYVMILISAFSPIINLIDIPFFNLLVPIPVNFLLSPIILIGKIIILIFLSILGFVKFCNFENYRN